MTQDALDPLITQLSREFATSEEAESRMWRQVPLKDSNLNLGSRTRKSADLIFSLPTRQHLTTITFNIINMWRAVTVKEKRAVERDKNSFGPPSPRRLGKGLILHLGEKRPNWACKLREL